MTFLLPRVESQTHRDRIHQLTKQRSDARKENKPNPTSEERARASSTRKTHEGAIMADVHELHNLIAAEIDLIALAHKRTPDHVRGLVYHQGRLSKDTRSVNAYNSWQHFTSTELSEDMPPSQLTEVKELRERIKGVPYKQVAPADLELIKKYLEDKRDYSKRGARSSAKSTAQDVSVTAGNISGELKNLSLRCGTSALMFIVRRDTSHSSEPMLAHDTTARAFCELFLGITVWDLAVLYESFSILGLRGITQNKNHKKNLLRRRTTLLVNSGLARILGKPASEVQMKWKEYVPEIVQRYGVGLIGWPVGITFNPHGLSIGHLTQVNEVLAAEKPTCFWRCLDQDEIAALVEKDRAKRTANPPQARKVRSDAGIPRKRKRVDGGGKDGDEVNADEDVEQEVDEDEDEDQ